ncbi:MAG TPA: recombinase family protein [Acetobacteraceae bacterium]|nr:recombinase family protein [Acetobacteraceae bacterium]
MSKITAGHLARTAFVYIRQSTPEQVRQNLESKRRQYALPDRARALGWQDVVVLDEDLGRSGSGVARPGFERLLAAICQGTVGAVVSIEASRLARNGRDWHTLLEFCGLVGTLIVDENGVFDPRLPDDRLLLGMKGTISEMELSTFRQRSREAIQQKARRGELFQRVAVGYQLGPARRLEKNPDQRIQAAIELVFRKFRELGSVRQVLLWLRQERIELPCIRHTDGVRGVGWRLPVYQTIHHILTNPVYAGAYSYGRTTSRVRLENGRKRVIQGVRVAREDWPVLLHDHHEGYIGWDEFEANQRTIADNANMKGAMARGAVRDGTALLAGLLRCGHCGRKLHVAYPGRAVTARYHCAGANVNHGASSCRTSFGSVRVDQAVSDEVIRLLQPFGLAAALDAIAQQEQVASEKQRQCELALKQARYEVVLARRQYDAVDPHNRLVAAELERRRNDSLVIVAQREAEFAAAGDERQGRVPDQEREELLALGRDLSALWYHPAASAAIRKRILRTVLREVVVTISGGKLYARDSQAKVGRAPLADRSGDRTDHHGACARPAGRHHRCLPQPRWSTHGKGAYLDQDADLCIPQPTPYCMLSRRRESRTRRADPERGRRGVGYQQDDRDPADTGQAAASPSGLPWRTLGHCAHRHRFAGRARSH